MKEFTKYFEGALASSLEHQEKEIAFMQANPITYQMGQILEDLRFMSQSVGTMLELNEKSSDADLSESLVVASEMRTLIEDVNTALYAMKIKARLKGGLK